MKIKICYIAGREEAYSRTRTVLTGLRHANFEVVTCLPPGKSFRYYPGLLWKFLREGRRCHCILVGFYGQLLLPFVRILSRKPILYDIYISTFDTMVHDRRKAKPGSFLAWLFRFVDRLSMTLSDTIILETRDHIDDFSRRFRIPHEKFKKIFLTADDSVIYPKSNSLKREYFLAHFHGEYAPFHGVRYIIEAANLLRNEDVQFQIIGTGITCEKDRRLAQEFRLTNIRFIDWIPYDQLADAMAIADCCLGIFGENPRTLRVLTNKVIETMAAAKPLISAKNLPIQELLKENESALLVSRADPHAISEAILQLKEKPEMARRLGRNGYKIFRQHCSIERFSFHLRNVVERMMAS
jgi:glycosyltransferase involved in cell wall biosynthesis